MKLYLYGRNLPGLAELLTGRGACVTDQPEEADVIITHGGDGSMLGAVQRWPRKRIYPIRDRETAPLCPVHAIEHQLDLFFADALHVTKLPHLHGTAGKRQLSGINDIFIHNKVHVSAIRYKVWIDDELYGREVVGDGVGVSTIHGSTAYYRSITNSTFRVGIGLAFSNSTELVNHLVLPENSVVRVALLRGPAELVCDNSPETIPLTEGDEAVIRLSDETTEILGLDVFMCRDCRTLRHTLRNSSRNF